MSAENLYHDRISLTLLQRCLQEIITVHPFCQNEDGQYLIDILCKYVDNLPKEHYIYFLLHSNYTTYIGNWSWVFNSRLNSCVKNRDEQGILQLLKLNRDDMFPEYSSNQNLDRQEVDRIRSIYMKELTCINIIMEGMHDFECSWRNCTIFNICENRSIYSKVYHRICLAEKQICGERDPIIPACIGKFNNVQNIKVETSQVSYIYPYEYHHLLEMLYDGQILLPGKRQAVNEQITADTTVRLLMELKLYRRARAILA